MSCVIGNRLCLNVRGMIWRDDDIVVTHSYGLGRRHASTGRATTTQQQQQRWPVVVFASAAGAPEAPATRSKLSEYEMDELRAMRVEHGDGGHRYPIVQKDIFTTPPRTGRI